MNYSELYQFLVNNSNSKFADFSKTLSNSDYKVIGVKNPVLRQIIKDHKNDAELKAEDFELGKYLEIDFIYFGLMLSRARTIDEQLDFLSKNIRKAKSWVITDCVQTFLKKTDFDTFLKFFKNSYRSKFIYERRFCYVFGLKHWKNSRILEILPLITNDEDYMVMMAEAWLLATIAVAYPDNIYSYLSETKNKTLMRKTISKICDSFRISQTEKEKFKSLR